MYLYADPLWLLVSFGGLLIAGGASMYCRATFARWSKIAAGRGLTGARVAAAVLEEGAASLAARGRQVPPGLGVGIEAVGGHLSDHYDPRTRTLRLSEPVYASNSVAAAGVAAHEAGHALQHAAGFAPLHIRTLVYPVTAIASQAAIPVFFLGLIVHSGILQTAGLFLFSAVVFFQVVTLPVEFDASRRALAVLRSGGILSHDELDGARAVLTAAALTYVAALLQSLLTLLYLLMRRERR